MSRKTDPMPKQLRQVLLQPPGVTRGVLSPVAQEDAHAGRARRSATPGSSYAVGGCSFSTYRVDGCADRDLW
jgi:hypothetical protein